MSEVGGGSSSFQAPDIDSWVQPRNQPSPRNSEPPGVSTWIRVPAPSGAETAILQAESVTELSRSRMATRSSGLTAGSVSPATRFGVGAVTSAKVAPRSRVATAPVGSGGT